MSADGFYYTVDGKRIELTKIDSIKFVSPARGEHPIAVGARLANSSRLSLYTRAPSSYLVVRGEPDKLSVIADYRDIARVRSAFMDSRGHEIILTDDVLVSFSPGYDQATRHALLRNYAGSIVDAGSDPWVIRITDDGEDAPLMVSNALSKEPAVKYAEPNALQRLYYASATPPSDPLFLGQWHLQNDGNGGTPGADVRARDAWRITTGRPDVRVVVIDSGVDVNHRDLTENIGPGKDFDNDDDDPSNNDLFDKDAGHGTACAGIIAARGNGLGVIGIAPSCKITPIRATRSHVRLKWREIFQFAVGNGKIVSCSWTTSDSNVLSDAIRQAVNQGVPCLFAVGNDGKDGISYPASMPETIAVGASTNQDKRAPYSNHGVGIDFLAPSSGGTLNIQTTDVTGEPGYNRDFVDGDYCIAANSTGFTGTSAATALAAGVAALMMSVNSNLTAEEVRQILRETADKIDQATAQYDNSGFSLTHGFGRINAGAAVREAQRRLTS